MFEKLIVNRANAAIELFAQCVHGELVRGEVPMETREWLGVLIDNALVRYQQAKGNDSNTAAVVTAMRPKLKLWINKAA